MELKKTSGYAGKQIGWVREYSLRLNFNQDGRAICAESGHTAVVHESCAIGEELKSAF